MIGIAVAGISVPKYDGSCVMDKHASIQMKPDASCQCKSLTVTAEATHVGRRVLMFHHHHFLMDNGTSIKISGGVVTRCSDQLHSAVIGPAVRIRSCESRQKRVVDVDDTLTVILAKPRGQNLHIAA